MVNLYDRNRNYQTSFNNAFIVGYSKRSDEVWEMSFSLPLNDPKADLLKDSAFKYIELLDSDGEYQGLYRILPYSINIAEEESVISCTAYQVINTLMDSVILGQYEAVDKYVNNVIQDLLAMQKTEHWTLGICESTDTINVDWLNEQGLIEPLYEILEHLEGKYVYTFNTKVYPWVLNLVAVETEPICRVKQGYNLQNLSVEYDPSQMVNRIYPVGQNEDGEPVYIPLSYVQDENSVNKYGPIEAIYENSNISDPLELENEAIKVLQESQEVAVEWSIKAADLVKLAEIIPMYEYTPLETLTIDRLRLNQMVRIETEELGEVDLVIKGESKKNMYESPQDIDLVLDNGKKNEPYSLTGVHRSLSQIRQKIDSNVYSIIARGRAIATDLINSGHGGFVRYYPNRILIMDTEDEATATYVWQFNLNGIGHSQSGVNGPYQYAWTIDGRFNTDFIETGSITTNMISNDYGTDLLRDTNQAISAINDQIADVFIELGANNLLLSVQSAAGGSLATQGYVQDAVDAINKANPNRISTIPESWEQGHLNTSTGDETTSSTTIRSKAYYPIRAGAVTMSMNDKYEGIIYFYDDNYQYKSSSSTFSSLVTVTIPSDYRFRVAIRFKSGASIVPSAIDHVGLKVENAAEATTWTPYFGDLAENLQNDYFLLVLSSDNGWVVDRDNWTTTLRAHLFWYNDEVTTEHDAFNFVWYRQYPGQNRAAVGAGYTLQVSGSDLSKSATYTCEFLSTDVINLLTTRAGDTLMTRNNDNIMVIGDY